MSATDYNPWGVAWEIDKAAGRGVRKAWNGAKVVGMYTQNWRHRGASEPDTPALGGAEDPAPYPGRFAKKSARKNWTTDTEELENTTTSHTTYTRKRTR